MYVCSSSLVKPAITRVRIYGLGMCEYECEYQYEYGHMSMRYAVV